MTNNEGISKHAVRPGIWTHYSGSQFEVIGVAIGSSYIMGDLVIYKGVRTGSLYYRPLVNFLDSEEVDGCLVPRFTFTGELTSVNQD